MYIHGLILLRFSLHLNVASGSSLLKVTFAESSLITGPLPWPH